MTISRKTLAWIYLGISLVALYGTWSNNLALFGQADNFVDVNLLFWEETLRTPASRSITVDILCLALPVLVWMFQESRKLGMSGIWLYYLACIFVAAGAAVPLFLAHRELRLNKRDGRFSAELGRLEVLGLALLATGIAFYVLLAVTR